MWIDGLDIKEFPHEIARVSLNLLDLKRELREALSALNVYASAVDMAIAANATLKNDAARKAARLAASTTDAMLIERQSAVDALQDQIEETQIDLTLLRDMFSVVKKLTPTMDNLK
jgi:ribosomal protein S20